MVEVGNTDWRAEEAVDLPVPDPVPGAVMPPDWVVTPVSPDSAPSPWGSGEPAPGSATSPDWSPRESSLMVVAVAATGVTSDSASTSCPSGSAGSMVSARFSGRSSLLPVTLIWTPSAPPVTKGSVPARPTPSSRADASASVRYHSDQPSPSRTRMYTSVPSASSAPPSQVNPVTKKGTTSRGSVRIAASVEGSRALPDAPRSESLVPVIARTVEPPPPTVVPSRAEVAISVGTPASVVRGRTRAGEVSSAVGSVPSAEASGVAVEANRVRTAPIETSDTVDMWCSRGE